MCGPPSPYFPFLRFNIETVVSLSVLLSIGLHDSAARAKNHGCSERRRKFGDRINELLGLVAGGKARTSTLATRLLEAKADRNQSDVAERMIGVERDLRDDAFPDGFL